MTKLHYVRRAFRTYRGTGVKKGMPYFWWKFSYKKKQYSLVRPKRSQLTRSVFLGAMMDLEDTYASISQLDGAFATINTIRDELEEIRDVTEESLRNMEEQFPNGCPTIELLTLRVEQCKDIIGQLDSINLPDEEEEEEEDKDEEPIDMPDILANVSWEYS